MFGSYGPLLLYFYGAFKSLKALDPVHCNCLEKSMENSLCFCLLRKKESHVGLEQHEGE